MKRQLPLAAALAALLIGAPARADDRAAQVASVDGALDAVPAPAPTVRAAEAAQPAARAPALPPAAQSEAWRAGARPPGEVSAVAVVRAAMRKPARSPRPRRADQAPEFIEIVWHAPGT